MGFWFERLQQLQQVLAAELIWPSAVAPVQEGLHRPMFCERDMQVAKLVQLQVGPPLQLQARFWLLVIHHDIAS